MNSSRPRRFDRNLIVIGGGAAGLVASLTAATLGAKVSLIERHRMGGDCLNTGCVPSKALLRAAHLMGEIKRAPELGFRQAHAEFDFSALMARVHKVIARVEPHDSAERYRSLGVDVIQGEARLTSPWTVAVDGVELSTRALVLATGGEPFIPAIPGLADIPYLTSDNLWSLAQLPERLLILGGGPIGCEMAQAFARLGSRVTLLEQAAQLLPREDAEVGVALQVQLAADGVHCLTGFGAVSVSAGELVAEGPDGRQTLAFDQLLVAVGRRPVTAGLGLDELGIETGSRGEIVVDAALRTRYRHILACGDVTGRYQLTHAAGHEGWHAAINGLFGGIKALKVDYGAMPAVVYTEPEMARVGLNEVEAQAKGLAYEVTRYDLAELDRAIADGSDGMVKVLSDRKGRLLGATVVAPRAGEMITEYTLALRAGWKLGTLLGPIRPYPSYAEAGRYVAAQWRRDHAPQWLLRLLARWHDWRLGKKSAA